ncbi:putative ribonuclease H-like domain-containing protein, partial [Tanacetum coccineum]
EEQRGEGFREMASMAPQVKLMIVKVVVHVADFREFPVSQVCLNLIPVYYPVASSCVSIDAFILNQRFIIVLAALAVSLVILRGVKDKENNANTGSFTASGTWVTAVPTCSPDVPSNITDIPNTGPETTVGTGQDTSGPSVVQTASNCAISFVSLVTNEVVTNKVNFRSLDAKAEVKIPKASILDVYSRFGFSLYGYFVGKRVAFSFASIEGMNGVLENGLWFIRSAPIIMKKWMPNANLLKEYMNLVPIWVKFHDIPIVAFTTEGLSVMATKLGNPIMLVSNTSSMCLQSWGRMDYARALIDIRADRELKKDMVIAIHNVKDDGEVLHMKKIDKLEHQFLDGKLMFVDHEGKPLYKVASTINVESDREVEVVFDETVNLMASTSLKGDSDSDSGYGTNNLLEQWRETKRDDDYDPYNDDLYESHDMSGYL